MGKTRTYNPAAAIQAQRDYLKRQAAAHPDDWMSRHFEKGEGFAPDDGHCYRCGRQIYGDGGISVEEAGTQLTTGCPFCHMSYVD